MCYCSFMLYIQRSHSPSNSPAKFEMFFIILKAFSFSVFICIWFFVQFHFKILIEPTARFFLWITIFSLTVSPDGLLLQSSTVADSTTFQFAEGTADVVPCSYIEFAERLVLPPYKNLTDEEVWLNMIFGSKASSFYTLKLAHSWNGHTVWHIKFK